MSILADTSVWIDHLKKVNSSFQSKLEDLEIFTHPMVIVELALGQMKNRDEFLGYIELLPKASEATNAEVIELIKNFKLNGIGLGAVDAQILASAKLSGLSIFTRDLAMIRAMKILKVKLFS